MRDLEIGMTIHFPTERRVQMGVLAYSADNLEAHSLGKRKLIRLYKSSCFDRRNADFNLRQDDIIGIIVIMVIFNIFLVFL